MGLSPLLAVLAGLACLPLAASAEIIDNVFDFKGTVTDIGVQQGPEQIGSIKYRITGKFKSSDSLDLTKSTVTFHELFDEEGGSGEMVLTTDNADLVCPKPPGRCVPQLPTLHSSSRSKLTEATYETPARFWPEMRVQIKGRDGEYQFNVRLDGGLSPQVPPAGDADPDRQFPQLCAVDPTGTSKRKVTKIRTSFTISDGQNDVVLYFVKIGSAIGRGAITCDRGSAYEQRQCHAGPTDRASALAGPRVRAKLWT